MRIKTKDDEERLEKSINKYPMEFKHNEAHLEGSKKGMYTNRVGSRKKQSYRQQHIDSRLQ